MELPNGVLSLTNQAIIATTVAYTNPANNMSAASNTVDAEAPVLPILLRPANGPITSTTSLTLVRQANLSADVAGYLLDFDDMVVDIGDVTQYNTGVLADGTHTTLRSASGIPFPNLGEGCRG